MELFIIILLTLIVFPVITFTEGVPRNILGMVFLLLFPGYTVMATLFPNKHTIRMLERIVVSIVISISLVILIGLVLNFTPWGIKLTSIYTSVSIIIIILSGIALFRRNRLPKFDRFTLNIKIKVPDWSQSSRFSFMLSLGFILIIIASISTLVYIIPQPKSQAAFTDFYILGSEGRMDDYPKELVLGESVELTLGIENHENQDVMYNVIMITNDNEKQIINSLLLSDGQTWSHLFTLEASRPGNNQKVEFKLYKVDVPEPYLSLHLWLDVKE